MKYLIVILSLFVIINSYFLYIIFSPKETVYVEVKNLTPTPTVQEYTNADKLFKLVNDWRVSEGYQPYIKDERLCAIAKDRVTNDPILDNHEGLYRKYSSYPYAIQENIVNSYPEDRALYLWLTSTDGHRETLEKPYRYSCIACQENYCSHIFSNF